MDKFRRFGRSRFTFRVRRKGHIKKDYSKDTSDEDGNNALHIAAKEGDNTKVKQLLVPEEFIDIHRQNFAGNDALMMAAYNGHLKVVKNLLAAGADVFAKNNQGESALELAKRKNYTEITDWILMNKTNFRSRKVPLLESSSVSAAECPDPMSVNSTKVVNEMSDIYRNLDNNSYEKSRFKAGIAVSEVSKYAQEETIPLIYDDMSRVCHNAKMQSVAIQNQDAMPIKMFHSPEDLSANVTTMYTDSPTVTRTLPRPTRSMSFSFDIPMDQTQLDSTEEDMSTYNQQKRSSLPAIYVQNVYFNGDDQYIAMNESSLNLHAKNTACTEQAEEVVNETFEHTCIFFV